MELPKRAHLRVPAFINTTKIQREDTQRGKKRMKFPAGDGKKERNFGRWRGKAVPGRAVSGRAVPGRAVPGRAGPGKGGPRKGGPGRAVPGGRSREGGPGKGGPNQTLKPIPTHETPLHETVKQVPTPHSTHKHTTQHTTHTHNTLHTTNQSRFWPKSVLAKVGFGQSRFWPKSVVGHTTKTLTHRTKNAHTSRMTRRARTQ